MHHTLSGSFHPSASNAAPQEDNNKLINIGLTIDESHLIKHIQTVVQRALQFTRQEVGELRHAVQKVTEDVIAMRKELLVIQDIKLRKLVTTLIDVRSAVQTSRAGSKALRQAVLDRRERQDAAESAGLFDPSALFDKVGDEQPGSSSGDGGAGGGDDVDLDSERIKSLELQCARLREQLRTLSEETTPKMIHAVNQRLDSHAVQSGELLAHLGLEVHQHHRGILHTLQSVTESSYMRPFVQAMEQNEKRIRMAEDAVQSKCDASDLEALKYAVSDVRGACESTQVGLKSLAADSAERLRATAAELKRELSGKVGWPDLDQWKASVNDALSKSKTSLVAQQHVVNALHTDRHEVQKRVDDLHVKVAELVLTRAPSGERADASGAAAAAAAAAASSSSAPPPDDYSHLLDGVDSNVKRRIQAATQAAYYAYADVTAPPHNIVRVDTTGQDPPHSPPFVGGGVSPHNNNNNNNNNNTTSSASGGRMRPRSALLMRR